jgi:hypothetical protein
MNSCTSSHETNKKIHLLTVGSSNISNVGSSNISNAASTNYALSNDIRILEPLEKNFVGFVCISTEKPRPYNIRRAFASAASISTHSMQFIHDLLQWLHNAFITIVGFLHSFGFFNLQLPTDACHLLQRPLVRQKRNRCISFVMRRSRVRLSPLDFLPKSDLPLCCTCWLPVLLRDWMFVLDVQNQQMNYN